MTRFLPYLFGIILVLGVVVFVRDISQVSRPDVAVQSQFERKRVVIFEMDIPAQAPNEVALDKTDIDGIVVPTPMHEDLNARLEAIADMAEANSPDAVSAHRAMLDDPLPAVREEAVESLAAIGGADSITGLGYALSDENDTVRRLAIEGLAGLGSDDAVNALALALDDEDADLRELAVEELATVGTGTATVVLQSFLADENHGVRRIAAELFEQAQVGHRRNDVKVSVYDQGG